MSEKVKKVKVTYTIPVEVVVNLETGEVERVDEWRSEVGGYSWGDYQTEDGGEVTDDGALDEADRIMGASEWPTWNTM